MKFITIGQYFNKLQSVLLFLLIIPLLAFISLSFYGVRTPSADAKLYLFVLPAIVCSDWLIMALIFNNKIKSVRNDQGLGVKLDKYFSLTILRFAMISTASMILALGFYLTRSDIFTTMFLGSMILSAVLWPTARKVSNDLHLRGAEREMVYFKKDNL